MIYQFSTKDILTQSLEKWVKNTVLVPILIFRQIGAILCDIIKNK